MSISRTNNAEQELIDAFMKNNGEILQKMLKEYFATVPPNSTEAMTVLTDYLDTSPIMINGKPLKADQIKMLGGTNNVNFMIETDDAEIVLQLGVRVPVTDTAVKSLSTESKPPKWLAKKHGEAVLKEECEFVKRESPVAHSLNKFPTKFEAYIAIVEKCPKSLSARIKEVHESTSDTKNEDILKLTQNIGSQIFSMLDDINKKGVIWTDMKPGNILLRDDDQLAIADTKAFNKPETMLYRQKKNENVINYSSAVTEGFLSQDFRVKKIEMACDRSDLPQMWRNEYSYQMAIMLYYLATNEQVVSPRWPDDIYPPLNFDLPVFKTEVGQRLQSIIERLAHDDPIVRLDCKDAAKLLENINNKLEFDAANDKLKQVLTAQYGQALLTKPFDPARIQTNEENQGKSYFESVKIELGPKAKAISLQDIQKIDINNFSEETIIQLREHFKGLIEEIEALLPDDMPIAQQQALKSGYVYYAFSKAIKEQHKKNRDDSLNTNDEDEINDLINDSAKLILQGELMRLICIDLNKPAKDSLQHIKEVNGEKITDIVAFYSTEGAKSTRPDYTPEFKPYESAVMRLGYHLGNFGVTPHDKSGISESNKFENGQDSVEEYIKGRIFTYTDLADSLIEKACGTKERLGDDGKPINANTKKALADAWGKIAARIQREMNSNEYLHQFSAMEGTYTRNNKDKIEFEQLCEFTNTVLSIENQYRKRAYGLYDKYLDKNNTRQKEKQDAIKAIHKRLDTILKDYPDKKSLNQVKKEMHDYLLKQSKELNDNGHTKTLIHDLIADVAEKIKPPVEKPTPGPAWYLKIIETDPNKVGLAILNRPFDATGYKKIYEGLLDPGVKPSDMVFGLKAKSLSAEDITKLINVDKFDIDTILKIRSKFDDILKDLEGAIPPGLTPEQEKAIKSGYLFNALMVSLRPLIDQVALASTSATKNNDSDAKELTQKLAILTLQSELIRLISDDLDKTPQESLDRIKQINNEKLDKMTTKCIVDGLTVENYDLNKGLKPGDVAVINFAYQLGNLGYDPNSKVHPIIPSQKFTGGSDDCYLYMRGRIEHFTSVMMPTIVDVATIKTKGVPDGLLLENIRDALANSWAKTSTSIQADVNKDKSFHTSPEKEDGFITKNAKVDDFMKLCRFTKNVLSIERNYLDRWHGLDKTFTEEERKIQAVKDKVVAQINSKLCELLQQHPEKKADDIRREMVKFLQLQIKYLDENLDKKPPLRDYISRTADKITILLKRESEETRLAMETVLGVDKKKESALTDDSTLDVLVGKGDSQEKPRDQSQHI